MKPKIKVVREIQINIVPNYNNNGLNKAGDESYEYYVRWNSQKREYEYGVLS
jgi:hypothetical protein